jgi:hypothetical protein
VSKEQRFGPALLGVAECRVPGTTAALLVAPADRVVGAHAATVMAEAVRWGRRGARVNTISPGIIVTSLAKDELTGPRGESYRRMLELSPVGRAGTLDEVATVAALLMGPDGGFITGSDVLMDGGVTASYFFANSPRVIDHAGRHRGSGMRGAVSPTAALGPGPGTS